MSSPPSATTPREEPAWAILGPTASGKSALALALARQLGRAELVSCDSMQVYRGLDIGTAKPTPAERAAIPHHLIDLLELAEPFTPHRFRDLATAAIAGIRARGAIPILVGGTGLYARTLLYDTARLPGDAAVARAVWQEIERDGLAAPLAELAAVDAALARELAPNPRRVARAVELLRLTGRSLRALLAEQPPPAPVPGWRTWVLAPDPEPHRDWIARRTAEMLAAGWIEETRRLVARGLLAAPTAGQALGYPEIAAFLAAGDRPLAALREQLVTKTWQFARRQRTWFRHQHPDAQVLPVTRQTRVTELLAAISR